MGLNEAKGNCEHVVSYNLTAGPARDELCGTDPHSHFDDASEEVIDDSVEETVNKDAPGHMGDRLELQDKAACKLLQIQRAEQVQHRPSSL
jgi:hypothetical protein